MENTFSFKFTETELNVICKALAELPYKESAPIFNVIQMQVQANNQNKPEEPEHKYEASETVEEAKAKFDNAEVEE